MLYGQLRFKFKMFQKQVTPFLKYTLIIEIINALKGYQFISFINHNRIVLRLIAILSVTHIHGHGHGSHVKY